MRHAQQALPPELRTPSTLQAGDGSSGDESESEVSDLPHSESDLSDELDGMKYRSRIVRTHLRNYVYLNEHCSMIFLFLFYFIYNLYNFYNLYHFV